MKLIAFVLFIAMSVSAQVNIIDRVKTRSFMLKRYNSLFKKQETKHKLIFKESYKRLSLAKRKNILKFIKNLDNHIPEKVLMPLVYWRAIRPNKQKFREVLEYYFMLKLLILRDYIDNPLTMDKARALSILRNITGDQHITTNNLFIRSKTKIMLISRKIAQINKTRNLISALAATPLIFNHYEKSFRHFNDHSLSYLGYIRGNNVQIISSKTTATMKRTNWFTKHVVTLNKRLLKPFKDPIFAKIHDIILESKESILIDNSLLGGTVGGTLAIFLLDQVKIKLKKNPDFKLLIIHDTRTSSSLFNEFPPIFSYLKKRIANDPMLTKSSNLLQVSLNKNNNVEFKVAHSKSIIIDGNSKEPKAYFGAKNGTDHSGAYDSDDGVYLQGPVAAAIQASYIEDITTALATSQIDPKEFSIAYLQKREILNFFKIQRANYPIQGVDILQLAEANIDAKIQDVRNILINMIINAKEYIYMDQLFLYDSYIVDTLIKKKINKPELKIKIIIDISENFGLNGLPNTFFLKEMKRHGIQIKSRILLKNNYHFPNDISKTYHQKYHRNVTTIDGRVILIGSSKISPDSLQGNFRELGAQLFNLKIVRKFNNQFIKDWNSVDITQELDIENFQAKIGTKYQSIQLSKFINQSGSFFYRNKDYLQQR